MLKMWHRHPKDQECPFPGKWTKAQSSDQFGVPRSSYNPDLKIGAHPGDWFINDDGHEFVLGLLFDPERAARLRLYQTYSGPTTKGTNDHRRKRRYAISVRDHSILAIYNHNGGGTVSRSVNMADCGHFCVGLFGISVKRCCLCHDPNPLVYCVVCQVGVTARRRLVSNVQRLLQTLRPPDQEPPLYVPGTMVDLNEHRWGKK